MTDLSSVIVFVAVPLMASSSLFVDNHATTPVLSLSSLPPLHTRPPTTASSSSITVVADPVLFLLPPSSFLPALASLFFETAATIDLRLSSLSSLFLSHQSTRSLLHGPHFFTHDPRGLSSLEAVANLAQQSLMEKEGDIFDEIDREFASKEEVGGGGEDEWETAEGYKPWTLGEEEEKEDLFDNIGGEKELGIEEREREKELLATLKGPNGAFGGSDCRQHQELRRI